MPGRIITLVLLTALTLLSTGCVYLRLLQFKHQLARFDRHFEADIRDGLKLTCKSPVLLDEDLTFFRLAPESRQRTGVAERWHFGWIKANLAAADDRGEHELTADFIFVDRKLVRVILPERFFAFFPKPLFLTVLRSLGHAEIDRERRTVRSTVDEKRDGTAGSPPPLTQADLSAMLGAPLEMLPDETGPQWHYRYHAASPAQRSGRIDITLTLDRATQRVQRIKGRVFDATIDVNFTSPEPPPALPLPDPAA